MHLFRLFSLASAIALSVAQNSSFASCNSDPQFNWMYNSLKQDPCTVAEFLGGACNNGVFRVPPLNRTQEYIGPTAATANECRCSTVFFSLLSACAICQFAQTSTWSFYNGNCSASYTIFTKPIPPGTAVPHWAYENVTASDGFDVSAAQSLTGNPESTASSATSTSTSTATPSSSASSSSSKSSNAGPIAGGVVGGVFAIALVVIIVLLIRRRKSAATQPNLTGQQQSLMSTGDKGYQHYPSPSPMQKPLLYDPSDPRTFPASPPPILAQTTAGSHGNMNPAITGSSFSSAPTAAGGAYFPGVAEV